jgi:hypothetical protein
MDNIFSLKDVDSHINKINLDELYEKKKQHDLNILNIYNRILNRVHNKIKFTSKLSKDNQFCYFVVPEIMIGIPKYDNNDCIAYILDKLIENEFIVKYIHPNLILISWKHWVPSYVRNEFKKKTGTSIDGWGNNITDKQILDNQDINSIMLNKNEKNNENKIIKEYKDINSYKPTGIYSKEILQKLEKKIS